MDNCLLCEKPCVRIPLDIVPSGAPFVTDYVMRCDVCGEYSLTWDAASPPLDGFVNDHLYLLSAVVRHHWDRRHRFMIDKKLLHDRSEFELKVMSLCPRGVLQRADYILRRLADNSSYPGSGVTIESNRDYPRFYCKNTSELAFHLQSLQERGLVRDVRAPVGATMAATLTAAGWERVEILEKPNSESKQAFVAMSFHKQLEAAFKEGIRPLEKETGFNMFRVDEKQFNDKICDHIIAEIRRSRFMIADVTCHRRAVYFEAGYAKGLGLEVIWTCREDHMKRAEKIFDTRQYNHIVWTSPEDLRKKLRNRILAAVGVPRQS